MTTQKSTGQKTAPKPCPRCGGAAGAGQGGNLCQCKKGKKAAATPTSPAPSKPEPCDITPPAKDKDDCGCSK